MEEVDIEGNNQLPQQPEEDAEGNDSVNSLQDEKPVSHAPVDGEEGDGGHLVDA